MLVASALDLRLRRRLSQSMEAHRDAHFVQHVFARCRFSNPVTDSLLNQRIEKHDVGSTAHHNDRDRGIVRMEVSDERRAMHDRHVEVAEQRRDL